MENTTYSLREADRVEILILMDNYVDILLTPTDVASRPPLARGNEMPEETLLAEHGLSLYVTAYRGDHRHSILFDTGYTNIGVPHNIGHLGLNLDDLEAIVLSHGHMDHTGSLYSILDSLKREVPLVLHPDAFLFPRYILPEKGEPIFFPMTLKRENLKERAVNVMEKKSPTLLTEDLVMVTGEIERVTPFEKGLPNAFVDREGTREVDLILDDQSLILNLKGKGLVVISGCSHAGIVNTALFARKMTGIETIHGLIGGFHLSGPFFEQIIDHTIEALKEMAPQVLVPMHCTGWKATHRFAEAFPASFALSSVGSRIILS
ncbi:MAG: MBL fold metallo-hydrolase [Desulfatiglans sp.]|jgi:7,8-dihydropterin-6-yl-methyl-4-(beta-D-ribofuranosyl)aminobenzene 5'-phosphate synthase|nr:MBL fold metallo-hydrolase [Thermodesulfobacteriota bacterium]MEE4351666.1 MBL fold metallo-hydrolase [Desulfatiglans sp.]